MKKHLTELEKAVGAIPRPFKASHWKMEDYIGAGESALIYLNHRIPHVRSVFKKGFSFPHSWEVWDFVWQNARHFEVMNFPMYFVDAQKTEDLLKHDKLLFGWVERIDNWGHSDSLSNIYARMLEANPKYISILKKWSTSKDPWKRRQSIVSLLYYSRMRKSYPPLKMILSLVEEQMDFDHYYVQKGVGWTLRECYNVYPKETLNYLVKNAARISPGAWYAATEKLSANQKKSLMKIRKGATA